MKKTSRKALFYYIGIAFGIIFVISFLTSQIMMPLFLGKSKSVKIPNLTNMNLAKASTILLEKKIHAVVKDSVWSDDIKTGYVISQKPEADEMIKPDGTVYLVVSKGSKYVKVPYVIGMGVQAAWIMLKNRNLNFVISDSVISDVYPPNIVVQSIPSAGEKAEKSSKIRLIISRFRESVSPDTTDVISDFEY